MLKLLLTYKLNIFDWKWIVAWNSTSCFLVYSCHIIRILMLGGPRSLYKLTRPSYPNVIFPQKIYITQGILLSKDKLWLLSIGNHTSLIQSLANRSFMSSTHSSDTCNFLCNVPDKITRGNIIVISGVEDARKESHFAQATRSNVFCALIRWCLFAY